VGIFLDGLLKKDSPKTKAGNWVASIKTSAKEVCQNISHIEEILVFSYNQYSLNSC